MAALSMEEGAAFEAQKFTLHCQTGLPQYAMPVFIRALGEDIHLTATFKHQKAEYRAQGCDPRQVHDRMWWLNPTSRLYEPYGPEEYEAIESGRVKL